MPDRLTPEQRHRAMSRVRTKDTDIELRVRSELHRRGLRFRKHLATLPGRPDVVFTRARLAVFVDGDFWHGYRIEEWESGLSDFWRTKIRKNIDRDQRNHRALLDMGWQVVRLWQHEIENDLNGCVERVVTIVKTSKSGSDDLSLGHGLEKSCLSNGASTPGEM